MTDFDNDQNPLYNKQTNTKQKKPQKNPKKNRKNRRFSLCTKQQTKPNHAIQLQTTATTLLEYGGAKHFYGRLVLTSEITNYEYRYNTVYVFRMCL